MVVPYIIRLWWTYFNLLISNIKRTVPRNYFSTAFTLLIYLHTLLIRFDLSCIWLKVAVLRKGSWRGIRTWNSGFVTDTKSYLVAHHKLWVHRSDFSLSLDWTDITLRYIAIRAKWTSITSNYCWHYRCIVWIRNDIWVGSICVATMSYNSIS